jgi:hypothetical protein
MAFLLIQTCYRNFERSVEMRLKFKAGSAAKKIFEAHQAGGKITFEYETKVYLGRFNR